MVRLAGNRAQRRGVFFKRVVDSVRVIIRDVIPDQTVQMNITETGEESNEKCNHELGFIAQKPLSAPVLTD